jgi:hypothetical protein
VCQTTTTIPVWSRFRKYASLTTLLRYTLARLGSPIALRQPSPFPSPKAQRYCIKIMLRKLMRDEDGVRPPLQRFRAYCLDENTRRGQWLQAADTAIASESTFAALLYESLDPRRRANQSTMIAPESLSYLGPGQDRFARVGDFPARPDLAILVNLIRYKLYTTTAAFLLQRETAQVTESARMQ